jgi:hypothetical protein
MHAQVVCLGGRVGGSGPFGPDYRPSRGTEQQPDAGQKTACGAISQDND